MAELESRTRNAIGSAFFEGYAYSQLAERAGVPLGTMKSWIRRGLQQLKGCLER
jgi:RNA polymerase sigma-70 factor (ECF subfamily)